MKHSKLIFVLTTLLLFSGLDPLAQDKSVMRLTPSSGLSSGFIFDIVEDRYGYIWVGTNVGLSQYNGYEFVNYLGKNTNSKAIKGTSVSKIIDYDANTLLIGTEQGLNVFDRGTQSFSLVVSSDSAKVIKDVIDILVKSETEIWVFTASGLFQIPADQLMDEKVKVAFYPLPSTREDNGTGLFGSLVHGPNNNLWLTSTRHSVQIFSPETGLFQGFTAKAKGASSFLSAPVWDVLVSKDGHLIMGGDEGVLLKKNGEAPEVFTALGDNQNTSVKFTQWLSENVDGDILIGTAEDGGVRWNIEKNQIESYFNDPSDPNSISSNDIHAVIEDSNQNLWFGHHNLGMSMLHSNKLDYSYTSISEKFGEDSPVNNLFHAIEDNRGDLWFPTRGGLIFSSGRKDELKVYNTANEDGFVVSADLGSRLFLVTAAGSGMYTFDKTTEKFTKVYQNDSIGIHGHFAENEDYLFFPTVQGSIVKVNKSDFRVHVFTPPASDMNSGFRISGIERDAAGSMIVELFYQETRVIESFIFDPETNQFRKFKNEREITPATRVPPVPSRFEPKVMWERSVYGIRKTNLETGQYEVYFESQPVIQESQRGTFVEDNDGYLWMNTATGIMQLDVINERIKQYTLPTAYEPDRLVKPFLVDSSDVLFTGYGGYLRFNAAKAQLETSLSNLYIDQIILEENKYDLLYEEIPEQFSYAQNDLSISYFAINYPDPAGIQYRYRVIGQDDRWIEVGSLRRVFLANLVPGKYTFQVQAAPRYGGYNITQSISFAILPPWWKTWWAYTAYLILLLLLGLAFHRYQRSRTIRKERERIKDEQLAQAREIEKAYAKLKATQDQLIHSEKMASLGELTAGIAHEIQNPLNFVNNFADLSEELAKELKDEIQNGQIEEAKLLSNDLVENLQKINHHGSRASEIVKSMLQHSRTGKGEKEAININTLAEEYLRLAFHGLKAKDKTFNASFETDLDLDLPKINVVPQEIGRVLLNLINNAFQAVRNEKQPKVIVRTAKVGQMLHIEVEDNGPGIAEELWVKIFQPFFTTKATGEGTGLGLSMSFDIVTKGHGGTISVENVKQGSGAIFKISLPI